MSSNLTILTTSEVLSVISVKNLFYCWPEAFVHRTSAKTRRAINFWLLVAWIFPGAAIWILLRDALWFVGFMSIYAIWVTHWSGFSAETPVEEEEI